RSAAEPQLAQTVAAVVETDLVGESPRRLLDAEHVDQELAQLAGPRRDPPGPLDELGRRAAAQPAAVVDAHHRGAAAGRAHDVVVAVEDLDEPLDQRPRGVAAAGV